MSAVVESSGAAARSSLPRGVLVAGGLVSLAAAALAGALVMKSMQPSAPAAAPTGNALVGQPVPAATNPHPAPTPVAKAPTSKPAAPTTSSGGTWNAPGATTQAVACASCGIVESVTAVQKKGEGSGLGAVAGGVTGGVVGHQLGGGKGKTALTVLGAVGGALAGHEVEKRVRSTTVYDVRVRMDDGSVRTFQRAQSVAVGTHVNVSGSTFQIANTAKPAGTTAPGMMQTSAPAPAST